MMNDAVGMPLFSSIYCVSMIRRGQGVRQSFASAVKCLKPAQGVSILDWKRLSFSAVSRGFRTATCSERGPKLSMHARSAAGTVDMQNADAHPHGCGVLTDDLYWILQGTRSSLPHYFHAPHCLPLPCPSSYFSNEGGMR